MGKLIVSMMVSVDGYIEGPGHEDGAWVRIDEEVHTRINRVTEGATALIYGRKVYEVMVPYWPDAAKDDSKAPYEVEFGRIWVNKPKVVFSRTLEDPQWNTRVSTRDVAQEVARMKRETNGYLLSFGGAQLVAELQHHGLVDEYHLYVNPCVFGAGIPFFRQSVDLALLEAKAFKTGLVALRYALAH